MPDASFQEAIETALKGCGPDDRVRIHRRFPGFDSQHVNDPGCWCGPLDLTPEDLLDVDGVEGRANPTAWDGAKA